MNPPTNLFLSTGIEASSRYRIAACVELISREHTAEYALDATDGKRLATPVTLTCGSPSLAPG